MIPFGLTKEQFRTKYRGYLDRASGDAIRALREVLSIEVRASAEAAEVEIFVGEEGTNIPAMWMCFKGPNTKIDRSDEALFPGRLMELSVGLKAPPNFDETYFQPDRFEGLAIAADAVRGWFAECWWKAGGWSYVLPVTLSVHDQIGDGESVVLSEGALAKCSSQLPPIAADFC